MTRLDVGNGWRNLCLESRPLQAGRGFIMAPNTPDGLFRSRQGFAAGYAHLYKKGGFSI